MSSTPHNTIFDDMKTLEASMLDPKTRQDAEDSVRLQRDFLMAYEYDAWIVGNGDTNDSYIVDIYENGYNASAGPDLNATRMNVTAYVLHNEDFFPLYTFVRVHLLPNNTCWILHQQPDQVAMIVCLGPTGEDDFTTNHYWVVPTYLSSLDGTTYTQTKYATNSRFYKIVEAVNLTEDVLQTHWLTEGMLVTLKWTYDSHRPLPNRRWCFERYADTPWIKILGNVGTYSGGGGALGPPYHYSWIEQFDHNETGVISFQDNVDGLSGTTTVNYALNVGESSGSTNWTQPIKTGTRTKLYIEFDDQCPSNVVYRFKEKPSNLYWGKVTTVWVPGTGIIGLTPVTDSTGADTTGEAEIDVSLQNPVGDIAQYCSFGSGAIVAYYDLDGNGTWVLYNNPLPISASQYDGFYNNSASGPAPNFIADKLRLF